ncbi:unnamed protein product, partial [Prorocentrum cordatum]
DDVLVLHRQWSCPLPDGTASTGTVKRESSCASGSSGAPAGVATAPRVHRHRSLSDLQPPLCVVRHRGPAVTVLACPRAASGAAPAPRSPARHCLSDSEALKREPRGPPRRRAAAAAGPGGGREAAAARHPGAPPARQVEDGLGRTPGRGDGRARRQQR